VATLSNDYRINALLAGNTLRWEKTTLPAEILYNPNAANISYSFMSAVPTYTITDGSGFSVFTEQQKAATRSIINTLNETFNVTLTEVADSATSYGQIRLGNSNQGMTSVGYSYAPNDYTHVVMNEKAGDIYINNEPSQGLTTAVVAGSRAWSALLHQLGHALGLKHSGDYAIGEPANVTTIIPPFLPTAEDYTLYTVMSANPHSQQLEREDFGLYDRLALTALYGRKPLNPSEVTYHLTDASGNSQKVLQGNGWFGTVDASAVTTKVMIDLNPGAFSSVGTTATTELAVNNLSMPFENGLDKAIGGKGNDTLTGTSFNNQLTGNAGNDTLEGGGKIDTALYKGLRSLFTLQKTLTTTLVTDTTGAEGSDTLLNMERLQFADTSVGIDTNSAQGYRIYRAAFDRVPDLSGLGFWINAIDNGHSLAIIAGSFISSPEFVTLYGVNPTPETFVTKLVYQCAASYL
jgi:serralysin